MTTWVTRERPKIDRIACPWLVRRFVEPGAEFLYVPTDRVFAVAKETGATPYDIPGAEPFAHDGALCSFDALIRHYRLEDPALHRLATIVRGADTARHDLAPEASGLHAISMGLSANIPDDDAMLEQGMVIYDALYAWCRGAAGGIHNWIPPKEERAAAPPVSSPSCTASSSTRSAGSARPGFCTRSATATCFPAPRPSSWPSTSAG